MITKKDKTDLINIIKTIDVKKMNIDHDNPDYQKWFRFGSFNALQIVCDVIKQLPESKPRAKKTKKPLDL